MIDGKACAGILTGAQGKHVAADSGDAEQPRAVIQQLLQAVLVLALGQQVQQHARIQRAAAAAHRQAVQRAEARGHLDAAAALDGAQAGAVAQVGDHHLAGGDLRRVAG